jgi:hypothetical protein
VFARLAIEVAINLGQKDTATSGPIQEKTEHGRSIKKSNIIRSIKLYTN